MFQAERSLSMDCLVRSDWPGDQQFRCLSTAYEIHQTPQTQVLSVCWHKQIPSSKYKRLNQEWRYLLNAMHLAKHVAIKMDLNALVVYRRTMSSTNSKRTLVSKNVMTDECWSISNAISAIKTARRVLMFNRSAQPAGTELICSQTLLVLSDVRMGFTGMWVLMNVDLAKVRVPSVKPVRINAQSAQQVCSCTKHSV